MAVLVYIDDTGRYVYGEGDVLPVVDGKDIPSDTLEERVEVLKNSLSSLTGKTKQEVEDAMTSAKAAKRG